MPKSNAPSRTQAIRQSLELANGPLSFDQLLAAVRKVLPLDAAGLRAGLNAVSNSYDSEGRLIQRIGEDQYAWLPNLRIGAVLRHTLVKQELKKRALLIEPEIITALWPAGIRFGGIETLHCQLSNGNTATLKIKVLGEKRWQVIWGTRGDPAFWEWLERQGAQDGDSLIFRIEAGAAASCRLDLEPRAARDEARVQERNRVLAEVSYTFVKTHRRGVRLDDIAARVIVQGVYHAPCPPDSLESVVNGDSRFRWVQDNVRVANRYDHLYQDLGLAEPDVFDLDEPSRKMEPQKRPSRKELATQVYRFRAAFRHSKSLWRRIEIRGDQPLRELDSEMRAAFGHDSSDHLSEFYLGVDADARHRGLGHHNPFEPGGGDEWRIGELKLKPGDELSYTYDFGDNIQHMLKLEAVVPPEPGIHYPRVIEQNKPRYRYCERCKQKGKKEIATWICIDCSNQKQEEVLVCEKHATSDHEDHYAEEIVY